MQLNSILANIGLLFIAKKQLVSLARASLPSISTYKCFSATKLGQTSDYLNLIAIPQLNSSDALQTSYRLSYLPVYRQSDALPSSSRITSRATISEVRI
jgi:hypothetical protein